MVTLSRDARTCDGVQGGDDDVAGSGAAEQEREQVGEGQDGDAVRDEQQNQCAVEINTTLCSRTYANFKNNK